MDGGYPGGHRFLRYSTWLKTRFDGPVRKVTVDAGFTCPNRDGTVGRGGCTYCNNRGFNTGSRKERKSVAEQVADGTAYLTRRYGPSRFIVYFQAYTNTYGSIQSLKTRYDEGVNCLGVVGLAIGTRPDCVTPEILDLIESYTDRWYVSLEYGVQSIHDRTLARINRGHTYQAFVDAMALSTGRRVDICLHVILGLPGESHDEMRATADALARFRYHSVKVHNLHIVRGTVMARQYQRGEIDVLSFEEYVSLAADFLERTPPDVAVQRLVGDAPETLLLAPDWCRDKRRVYAAIEEELLRRESWQGRLVSCSDGGSTERVGHVEWTVRI